MLLNYRTTREVRQEINKVFNFSKKMEFEEMFYKAEKNLEKRFDKMQFKYLKNNAWQYNLFMVLLVHKGLILWTMNKSKIL